jgi:hypothetical protein
MKLRRRHSMLAVLQADVNRARDLEHRGDAAAAAALVADIRERALRAIASGCKLPRRIAFAVLAAPVVTAAPCACCRERLCGV